MTSTKFLTVLLLVTIIFILPTSIFAQRRDVRRAPIINRAQSSGEQEATRFWNNYVASCSGTHYVRKAPGIFVELRGFHIQMRYDPITEADKLNGIEAKGQSSFEASAYRIYSNSSWHAWGNGIPDDMQLINSVIFQKTRGRWKFYGVGYFSDYAKTVTCSDLPWMNTAKKRENATNAIMINDTHVYPIKNFVFLIPTPV
jgi:hypothetical protein